MAKKTKPIFHVKVDTGTCSITTKKNLLIAVNKAAKRVLGKHGEVLTTEYNVDIIRVL